MSDVIQQQRRPKRNVALDQDQLDWIEQRAVRTKTSRSAVLRVLVDLGIQQQERLDKLTEAVA